MNGVLHLRHPVIAQNQDNGAVGQCILGLSQGSSSRMLHAVQLTLLCKDMFP